MASMATKERIPDTFASKDTLEDQGRANIGRIILLVIGDVIVFLIFAAVGRRSYGEAASISSLLQVAGTAAPFALGWFIVAPFIGAYRRHQTTGVGNMAQRT